MGHIREVAPNKWHVTVEVGSDPLGNRRRLKRVVHGSERDARKKLRELELEAERLRNINPLRMNLAEYLRWWIDQASSASMRANTAANYRVIIESHLIPHLGHIKVEDLCPAHLEAYMTRALRHGRRDGKGGLSPRSVQYHMHVLSSALSYAVQTKRLVRNVVQDVQVPRPPKKRETFVISDSGLCPPALAGARFVLDAAGVRRLFSVAQGHQDYDLIYTAVYTGLRREELLALTLSDLYLDYRVAYVQRVLHYIPGQGFRFDRPKTEGGVRSVPLTQGVVEILKRRRAWIEERRAEQPDFNPMGIVFCRRDGTPEKPDNVTHRFRNLANRAGYPRLTFHGLRHTFSTLLMAVGVQDRVVQELLGHDDIGTTAIYQHPFAVPSIAFTAVDALESYVGACAEPCAES